jgi:hypothetical protein
MHLVYVLRRVSPCGKKWFQDIRVVDNRREGDYIPQMDGGSGFHMVGLVLFQAGVPQCYLLLIVEPVLVIRSQAGVEDPLLKTQAASLRVVRIFLAVGAQGVSGEMRVCGDNGAPLVNQRLRATGEDIAGAPQPPLVFLPKIRYFVSVAPALAE